MAAWALVFFVIYLALAFGLRTAVQLQRTGSSGFHGISGARGSAEWFGGVLFVVALVIGFAAPLLDLTGVVEPVGALDGEIGNAAGVGLSLGGLLTTLRAQFGMGESWRIGVDESERTSLVTDGPFSIVRNPIFTAMMLTSAGLVLLVPSVVALVGFLLLVVAIELQVRSVEEPYLRRTHGKAFTDYAGRVGRFLPGLGRLRS
ncbi:MAG: isoprenylcysteine carboxylmethyltransferase family protein [Actinomycetota bacterium]|nr:isoprenylcysteine carboxylmethyltransferase family protein [Actinomycetota bacterium]